MDGDFANSIDGLVQDCRISISNALEILQSCTKPSIWSLQEPADAPSVALLGKNNVYHVHIRNHHLGA